jgi:hypothetical protein
VRKNGVVEPTSTSLHLDIHEKVISSLIDVTSFTAHREADKREQKSREFPRD